MRRTAAGVAGLVLLTLVNLTDLISITFVGTPGNPAVEIVPSSTLALIGLAATVPAWRGRRRAVAVVFCAAAVSLVIGVVYYVVGDQPDWVRTGMTIGILVSLLGVVLVAVWWRQTAAAPAARRPGGTSRAA